MSLDDICDKEGCLFRTGEKLESGLYKCYGCIWVDYGKCTDYENRRNESQLDLFRYYGIDIKHLSEVKK